RIPAWYRSRSSPSSDSRHPPLSFLMLRRPPSSPLFPYTTLSRSQLAEINALPGRAAALGAAAYLRLVSVRRRDLAAIARRSAGRDRKSTRLNSSHLGISYAVFCLKKKKLIPTINAILTVTTS